MSDFGLLDVQFKIKPTYIPATALKKEGTVLQGGVADVWQCSMSTQVGTWHRVAVKSTRVYSSADSEVLLQKASMIRREAYVWIQLNHDHILPLEGVTTAEIFGPLPALVSLWMEEGSLDGYLMRQFSGMSDHRKQELIWQVASGLSYLHDKGIVHGDLTPTNILVDGSGSLRIGDFGRSIILAELENATFDSDLGGNVRWMPPECFYEGEDVSTKPAKSWDIYSYGCVMLQILSGKQPYATLTSVLAVLSAVFRGRVPFDTIQSYGGYGKLSERCLHQIPADRPTIHDIISFLKVLSNVGPNIGATQHPVQRPQHDTQHPMQRLEDICPVVPAAVEDPSDHRRTTSYVLRHFSSFPPYRPDVDIAPNFSLHPRRRFLSLRAPHARAVGGTTTSLYVASPPNSQTTWRRETPVRAMSPLPPSPRPSEVATTTTYLSLSPPPSTVLPSVTISAHTPVPEQIGCCTRFLRCIQYCICCSICHKLNVYSHGHSQGH